MLHEMGYDDDTTHADDVPSFDKWLRVNGRPAELLDGQHRVAALKRLVSGSDTGKEELYWPCNIYDRNGHGDIWVQLATVASERPGIFHGTVAEMEEQILDALRLSGDVSFPLPRLVTIWRNERWRQMTTRWCETTVGRATFQISTWDWMICHRIDDVCIRWMATGKTWADAVTVLVHAFRQVLGTLAQLPGDAAKLVSFDDCKMMSASLDAERTQEQVQELFYQGQSGKPLSAASKSNPKLLQSFDDRGYWDIYDRVLRTSALRFADVHRLTGMSKEKGRVLFQVLDQVVTWLNPKRTAAVNPSTGQPRTPPKTQNLAGAIDEMLDARNDSVVGDISNSSSLGIVPSLRERFPSGLTSRFLSNENPMIISQSNPFGAMAEDNGHANVGPPSVNYTAGDPQSPHGTDSQPYSGDQLAFSGDRPIATELRTRMVASDALVKSSQIMPDKALGPRIIPPCSFDPHCIMTAQMPPGSKQ
ncbi:hypothetical protein PCL_07378 [Purpureocillium lilacinum]|uniref:Uncharacterized protein n=1 Tax=Purpureocillium lilacinum TaxID=33203 RepID=A0A2U3DS57_PURLI|nr:hypothetical protein PCL_07378 [Purpureocillium lilacinum]